MLFRVAVAASALAMVAGMTCPSSASSIACGMKITTTAAATCDAVLAEMKARVSGQYGAWHDPHNNGTYTVQTYGGTFSTSRVTGDGKYTDKQIFTLTDSGSSCKIEGCSRSQVFSLLDMGTNYCDLKMLFCGSADGCKPVLNDFTVGSEKTEKFAQSSVDMSSCLKLASQPTVSQPPVSQPPVSQPPVSQPPVSQPPVSQPPVSQPPVSQLPSLSVKPELRSKLTLRAEDAPCCKNCVAPLEKYFSVDVPHGFCGETCMDPKKFWLFKIFESNLTIATDNTPCSEQFTPTGGHYTNYTSTVTHGVPGLLSVTLDLYGPVGSK